MSVLGPILPTLAAAAVVVFFAIRAVRRSNRADAAHQAEYVRRLAASRAARAAAAVPPDARAVLSLTLDLDDGSFPNLALVAGWAEQLVTVLDPIERDLGGRGLTLAAVRAEPGRFELLFRPDGLGGSSDRVQRMAELLNVLIEDRVGAVGDPPLRFDLLPTGVVLAHAGVTLAA